MTVQAQTHFRKYGLFYLVILLLAAAAVFIYLGLRDRERVLTFAMIDVGQGDALFIESPTGAQILVDGGPPRKVLGELRKLMPLFDRTLDAIIITNPDADHIGGFVDILEHYKVGMVLEPGTWNDSKTYKNLKSIIEEKNISEHLARRGMRLDLGGGAVIDILFPDRDVSTWTTNDGSVVAKLTYGETTIMLAGDATTETEKIILADNAPQSLDVDILKVGHHGSHTSTSEAFVSMLTPEYALISLGEKNRYGHPHQEVLDVLLSAGVRILRTDQEGTVVFKCDKIGPCQVK
jgi:competence protein ComEC